MKAQTELKEIGTEKIPADWEFRELKTLLKNKGYIRGPFGSALRRPELKSSGVPVYEQANAIYDHRNFRFFIDDKKCEEMKRFMVEENDLLISCSGTFGKVSIIRVNDQKGIISQALLILRPDSSKINPEFLKYFFVSDEGFNAIASRSLGSVQVNIAKREVIEKIELAIPKDRQEQDKIIKILSDLDSKVKLNQQMNQTLEEIAQTLFKKWFIDFEFPNEKGNSYKSSGGKMVWSEELQKEIPAEWRISIIGAEAETVLGGTPSTQRKDFWDNGTIAWINSGKVNEFRITEPSALITKEAVDNSATKLLPKGATVLAITGATLGQMSKLEIDTCANQSVVGIVQKKSVTNEYIYCWLKENIGTLLSGQTGGAQQHVNKNDVNNMKIVVPLQKEILAFQFLIKPIFESISNNCFELQSLDNTRDYLLPKLMSGKIRVHNA